MTGVFRRRIRPVGVVVLVFVGVLGRGIGDVKITALRRRTGQTVDNHDVVAVNVVSKDVVIRQIRVVYVRQTDGEAVRCVAVPVEQDRLRDAELDGFLRHELKVAADGVVDRELEGVTRGSAGGRPDIVALAVQGRTAVQRGGEIVDLELIVAVGQIFPALAFRRHDRPVIAVRVRGRLSHRDEHALGVPALRLLIQRLARVDGPEQRVERARRELVIGRLRLVHGHDLRRRHGLRVVVFVQQHKAERLVLRQQTAADLEAHAALRQGARRALAVLQPYAAEAVDLVLQLLFHLVPEQLGFRIVQRAHGKQSVLRGKLTAEDDSQLFPAGKPQVQLIYRLRGDLRRDLRGDLRGDLGCCLGGRLRGRLGCCLGGRLGCRLRGRLGCCLGCCLGGRLGGRLGGDLRGKLRAYGHFRDLFRFPVFNAAGHGGRREQADKHYQCQQHGCHTFSKSLQSLFLLIRDFNSSATIFSAKTRLVLRRGCFRS